MAVFKRLPGTDIWESFDSWKDLCMTYIARAVGAIITLAILYFIGECTG
ncbi:MAG: hypothetical protein J1E58_00185 [Prevotella sp.]|nr:hypothetical protein [Prevotella sp.]